MIIVSVILGIALLIWGRELFWLFIAGAGFIAGLQLASRAIPGPVWVGLVVGIGFAILAALLAVFIKTVAIHVAGFLMGGVVLTGLANLIGMDAGMLYWAFFLVGGIAGAVFVGIFFDFAVIWLSALAGTSLLMGIVNVNGVLRYIVFAAILFLGVIIQTSQLKKDNHDD
jgi:hypothetical protein